MIGEVLAVLTALVVFGLALWKPNPVLFMVAAGILIISGFKWWDYFPDDVGLATSLMLVAFSFVNLGLAYRVLFWSSE